MIRRSLLISLALACALIAGSLTAFAAPVAPGETTVSRLVAGLQGGAGSAIGPDGALYVPETAAGRIVRVDLQTGGVTAFVSGLPISPIGLGGVVDVEFIGPLAYALVTLVGPDVGGTEIVGIYRIDGPDSWTVVADIGAWAVANPPPPLTTYDVPTGVQYAMEQHRGNLLVSDGHHNRVLRVGLNGSISTVIQLGNDVPTGLSVLGNKVFLALAGPVPHLPEYGRVIAFQATLPAAVELASGAPLLVDVEAQRAQALFALSQGDFPADGLPAEPALPNTGALLRAQGDGSFTAIAEGLNQPTSFELVGDTAYVVTLGGEVWKIDHVLAPPFGLGPQR